MTNKKSGKSTTLIVVAIVGAIGAILAATIGAITT
jgi:hypothetical protein